MKPVTRNILLALVVVGCVAAGFALERLWFRQPPAPTADSTQPVAAPRPARHLVARRPDFAMPDLSGVSRDISEWDGKAVLVNFWATWCGPCRKEIPLLIKTQKQLGGQGLQVIGIAVDDPKAVHDFASHRVEFNYPVLVGEDEAMAVAHRFGTDLVGLPYSILIDRQGNVVAAHAGELDPATLDRFLRPVLSQGGKS
ncbi:MAG: TlpA disulfide reductase family protein [Gammaproteobacteria bacterium]|jgi:thiol-disulfide isomerase/thioredoxin